APTHFDTCFVLLFTAAAPAEIYTLSLHDALPILRGGGPDALFRNQIPVASSPLDCSGRILSGAGGMQKRGGGKQDAQYPSGAIKDRKSTRLNSSHVEISYAVFCLKKKKKERESEE